MCKRRRGSFSLSLFHALWFVSWASGVVWRPLPLPAKLVGYSFAAMVCENLLNREGLSLVDLNVLTRLAQLAAGP